MRKESKGRTKKEIKRVKMNERKEQQKESAKRQKETQPVRERKTKRHKNKDKDTCLWCGLLSEDDNENGYSVKVALNRLS